MFKWSFSIWSPLFCTVGMLLSSCESFCPKIWHPYRRCESKIAKYIVLRRFLLTKCLILGSRLFALFNLVLGNSICFLNFRFSLRFIPRYFVWVNEWIFWPLIRKFRFLVITLFFDRNSISSVLSALREILLALSQWIMFFKSKLTFLFMSFMDLLTYNNIICKVMYVRVCYYVVQVVDVY